MQLISQCRRHNLQIPDYALAHLAVASDGCGAETRMIRVAAELRYRYI
jgi:hypothetical protein